MTNQTDKDLMVIENTYWVEQFKALKRLEQNPDYKLVIEQGYLKDRALDAVSLLAHPNIKEQGLRSDTLDQLMAISGLINHLLVVKNLGSIAEEDLKELQELGIEE